MWGGQKCCKGDHLLRTEKSTYVTIWGLNMDKLTLITKTHNFFFCTADIPLILGSKKCIEEEYDISRQSPMSGSASMALLITHERDEEQPRDRWSPNTTWPSRLVLYTHKRTEQPLSCASKSPDGPSVSPLCPAGCRASGAHRSPAQFSTRSLAGRRRDSLACWRSNANCHSLLSCCSAATLPPKKKKVCLSLL